MLWYLHLCAEGGIVVIEYSDRASKMSEAKDGSGKFTEIVLQPKVTIAKGGSLKQAKDLHQEAHKFCFIANSVNFPILCQPVITEEI